MTHLERAKAFNRETKEALTLLYTALNQGQQKKVLKNAEVKAMLMRYGVVDDDSGDKAYSGLLTED